MQLFSAFDRVRAKKEFEVHLGICNHPKFPAGHEGMILAYEPSSHYSDDSIIGGIYCIRWDPKLPEFPQGFETRCWGKAVELVNILDKLAREAP